MKNPFNILGSVYRVLAPYIVPLLLVLSLNLYNDKPNTIYLQGENTIETRYLVADTDTVTIEVDKPIYHTVLDTVYLKGDTIRVAIASADTTFHFITDSMQVDVNVGAVYYHPPINVIRLLGKLDFVNIVVPTPASKKFNVMYGPYMQGNQLGFSAGVVYKQQMLLVGTTSGTRMFMYQRMLK